MLVKVSFLLVIVSTLVSIVPAFPVYETNAQRMARGLPPNPPAQLARRITAVRAAKVAKPFPQPSPQPSPRPSNCYAGRIEVRSESGSSSIGFVRNWENGGISGINFSGDPLEVKVCKAGKGLYDIIATNAVFPAPFYVGAGSGTVARSLATGVRSSIGFGNVPQIAAGAPPTLIDGNYYESAIWSYNPSTKEISPQWINPDGSKPDTIIAYDIRANGLFLVGDISVWNEPGFFASTVQFYLA